MITLWQSTGLWGYSPLFYYIKTCIEHTALGLCTLLCSSMLSVYLHSPSFWKAERCALSTYTTLSRWKPDITLGLATQHRRVNIVDMLWNDQKRADILPMWQPVRLLSRGQWLRALNWCSRQNTIAVLTLDYKYRISSQALQPTGLNEMKTDSVF